MQSEVSIRVRSRLPFLWLLIPLIFAFVLPHRIWNMLLLGFGGLLIIAYYWAREVATKLTAYRRLRYGWVAVGDRLLEEFELISTTWFPIIFVEIIDESNVPDYAVSVVRGVATGSVRWHQEAICQQRGQFRLGPWKIHTTDPFGIFEVTFDYPISDEVIIHPPIDSTLPIPLPAGTRSGRARARQRALQATINAASIRDYQPNDPMRWIHWPSSARRNRLIVRQFDLDAAGDIWLVVDLEAGVQLGQGFESTVEYGVMLAASLTARAIRGNRPVGLGSYGATPRIIPAARGVGHQWRMLRALALLEADGHTDLRRSLMDLSRHMQQGAAVIIITPRADADWLPGLVQLGKNGVQSNVIFLDRNSFGGNGNTQAMVSLVERLGYNSFTVNSGQLQRHQDPDQRRGFWGFQTTATGRVIVTRDPSAAR